MLLGVSGTSWKAALKQTVTAIGAIINVEPEFFQSILSKMENPLVVVSTTKNKLGKSKSKYLASYKGLIFYTNSTSILELPRDAQIIEAKSIWVPDFS